MPDNNNINEQADILSKLLGRGTQSQSDQILKYIRQINDTLAEMNDDGKSNARKQRNDRATATTFQDRFRDRNGQSKSSTAPTARKRNGFSSVQDSFVSGFQSEFTDKIKRDIGTQFRKQIGDIYDDITKELGISLKDAPNALGKAVGLKLRNTIRSSGINKVVESKLNEATQGIKDYVFNKVASIPSIAEPLDKLRSAYIQGRDAAGQLQSKVEKQPSIPEKGTEQIGASEDTQSQRITKVLSSIPDVLKVLNGTLSSVNTSQNLPQQNTSAQDSLDIISSLGSIGGISSIIDSFKNFSDTPRPSIADRRSVDLNNCCCCNADMMSDKDDILSSALDHISDIAGDSIGDAISDVADKLSDVTSGNYTEIIDTVTSLVGDSSSAISDVSSLASTVAGDSSASIAGFTSVIDTALPMLKEGAADLLPMLTNEVLPGLISAGQTAAPMLVSGLTAAGTALAPIAAALPTIGLGVVAAVIAFEKLDKILEPVRENFKKLSDEVKRTFNRIRESRTKNADLATERLQKDIETMVKKPFEILQSAAEEWYSTWNSNLKVISATQGYSKADLQTLMGNYAERLRQEGLESYVSASDISANLANVLKEGLSGQVAEEFAYIATKLNAAVPTQDFFQSASSYASIVANAVKDGKSQAEAIKLANDTMMQMASNVLYASRELTSGVTTGLKDAQSIMERSIQIAQTGRTDNAVAISGVMTSVSAIVGAIAPDLASAMTDAVYKAAVGGNSSELVALRSLAGINASNTEFLRQLTDDPKKVFVDLFENLGRMQNMSQDAYMEVAEGLSNIFGLSMDTFARVDFEYLARSIANMSTTSNAIDENLELLMSGQTTTTAEQLKIQQINKYMIDEGLAYVIDNEAAQMIQQHMWDEQIARNIMEAQYSVDLAGSSLQFIESIAGAIDNILMFLNPIGWFTKLGRLIVSTTERKAMDRDIRQMLELGKVGTGQELSKYQLTTRNRDLALTKSLVGLMGGISEYSVASGIGNIYSTIGNLGTTLINNNNALQTASARNFEDKLKIDQKKVNSSYSWGSIGKSTASVLNASTVGPHLTGLSDIQVQESEISNTALAQAKAEQNLQDMFDSMDDYVRNDKDYSASYEDWVSTAKKYGISDFSAAIEDAGITDEKIRAHFDGLKMQIGAQIRADRDGLEESFWDASRENLVAINETSVSIRDITDLIRQTGETHLLETIDFKTITSEILTNIFDMNSKIYDEFLKFYASWVDYYVDHTAYSSAYDHEEVSKIQREEKAESEDAVYALADALTKNTVDLLDPTVQTNALLSQILKVANAILNATNTPNGTTIPDSLSGMALGLTSM